MIHHEVYDHVLLTCDSVMVCNVYFANLALKSLWVLRVSRSPFDQTCGARGPRRHFPRLVGSKTAKHKGDEAPDRAPRATHSATALGTTSWQVSLKI